MSIFGSSSSSTTKAPNTGVQTGQAPGVAINTDNYKSNEDIEINQVLTDHGAVTESIVSVGQVGEEAIRSGTDVAIAGIDANENVVGDVIKFLGNTGAAVGGAIRKIVQENTFAVETALNRAESIANRSLNSVDDAIDANREISRDSISLAGSVIDVSERIADDSFILVDNTVEEFGRNTELVVETLGNLEEGRQLQTNRALETISELATVVQTGGKSISENVNKVVLVAAILVVGAVAWRASK